MMRGREFHLPLIHEDGCGTPIHTPSLSPRRGRQQRGGGQGGGTQRFAKRTRSTVPAPLQLKVNSPPTIQNMVPHFLLSVFISSQIPLRQKAFLAPLPREGLGLGLAARKHPFKKPPPGRTCEDYNPGVTRAVFKPMAKPLTKP